MDCLVSFCLGALLAFLATLAIDSAIVEMYSRNLLIRCGAAHYDYRTGEFIRDVP